MPAVNPKAYQAILKMAHDIIKMEYGDEIELKFAEETITLRRVD